ncbi:MAG: hypothetical protein R2860_04075 [Desulfobacterales bacterium]
MLAILNAKNQKRRKAAYMDLLRWPRRCSYARAAEKTWLVFSMSVFAISEAVKYNVDLILKVIDRPAAESCWVKVPALEKVVSIFEPHTDIIIKGPARDDCCIKCLTGGASNLILDCRIFEGNHDVR